jgi:hypothetical protein
MHHLKLIVPCAEFVERDEPECTAGRRLPEDCQDCMYYRAGLTDQERRRAIGWAANIEAMERKKCESVTPASS